LISTIGIVNNCRYQHWTYIIVINNLYCRYQQCMNAITACVAALCSVKDGFSSKGKTKYLTAPQTPTLWLNNTKLGNINNVGEFYKCAKFNFNQLRKGVPTYWWNITPMCIFSVCIYRFIYIYIFLPRLHSPNHASNFNTQWLKWRGLVQGSAFWG